jgi:hypothetical protein
MIARLPEMHRQLRELSARIAEITAALPEGHLDGLMTEAASGSAPADDTMEDLA